MVGLREASGAWCACEKCGSNMFLLLPGVPASGALSSAAICPTQHRAHSRQSQGLQGQAASHLSRPSKPGVASCPTSWPGYGFLFSCPVVISAVRTINQRPSPTNDRHSVFYSGAASSLCPTPWCPSQSLLRCCLLQEAQQGLEYTAGRLLLHCVL